MYEINDLVCVGYSQFNWCRRNYVQLCACPLTTHTHTHPCTHTHTHTQVGRVTVAKPAATAPRMARLSPWVSRWWVWWGSSPPLSTVSSWSVRPQRCPTSECTFSVSTLCWGSKYHAVCVCLTSECVQGCMTLSQLSFFDRYRRSCMWHPS